MAVITPIPKTQFIGADGIPLVGGKVYTYSAGTTSPLATYTDSSGSTPNTNPIILDSRGEANIWLGEATYKFKLTDANDVEQWTVDYISAPTTALSPVLSGNVTISTDSSGPALKITQTGTGDVLRVQDSTDPDLTPFVITSAGAVGIGTVAPAEALDIDDDGKIQFSAAGTPRTVISADATNSTFDVRDNRNFVVKTNGGTRLTISGSGTATFTGAVALSGGITITGNSSVTGTLTVSSTLTASNGLTVSAGGLTVSAGGLTVSAGGATITGNSLVTGTFRSTSTLTASNGLTVSAGGAGITGNSSVTGTFGVSGATTLSSTLGVTGAATFSSTMSVTSNVTAATAPTLGSHLTNKTYVDGQISTCVPTSRTVTAGTSLTGGGALSSNITISVASSGITDTQLASNSVTTVKITDSNVTTAKIADSNVTTAKIADSNVTTVKIADSNVTTAKIADSNVTTAKIADANITPAKLNGAQSGSAPIYGVRAWGCISSTGTVNASGNVASVSRLSADFTVTLSTAMSDTNYAVVATIAQSQDAIICVSSKTTSSFIISTADNSGAAQNYAFDFMVMR